MLLLAKVEKQVLGSFWKQLALAQSQWFQIISRCVVKFDKPGKFTNSCLRIKSTATITGKVSGSAAQVTRACFIACTAKVFILTLISIYIYIFINCILELNILYIKQ